MSSKKRTRHEAAESGPTEKAAADSASDTDGSSDTDSADCIFMLLKKHRSLCKITSQCNDDGDITQKAKFDIDYLFADKVFVKLRAEVKQSDDDEIAYTATASVGEGTALFNFINDGYGCMPMLTCSAAACAALLEAGGMHRFEVFSSEAQKGKIFSWPPKDAKERDAVLRLALVELIDQFSEDLGSVKRASDKGIDAPGWSADDPLVVAAVAKTAESDGTVKPIRRGGKRSYIGRADW